MADEALPVVIDDIRAAAEQIAGEVVMTPTVDAAPLSRLCGCRLALKLESQQATGSFKDRGALVKLKSLDAAARERGVIAMSAGNHAQGVAYHAARLSIPATIIMPTNTPFTKVGRTKELGATVILRGENLDDARDYVDEQVAERGLTLIHPYDDPAIIAGQGTVALEMLAAVPDLDDLVVPIGGGGLISGISIAAKEMKPDIRITGVEASQYPSMTDALQGKEVVYSGATIAEGIAVKRPGLLTRTVVRALVDHIQLVDEAALECAVQCLMTEQKIVAEGAGAAGIAAVMEGPRSLCRPPRRRGDLRRQYRCPGDVLDPATRADPGGPAGSAPGRDRRRAGRAGPHRGGRRRRRRQYRRGPSPAAVL